MTGWPPWARIETCQQHGWPKRKWFIMLTFINVLISLGLAAVTIAVVAVAIAWPVSVAISAIRTRENILEAVTVNIALVMALGFIGFLFATI